MLELKSVTWQNFLSYGDYPTTIELDKLGQCLIVGEVLEDERSRTSDNDGIKTYNSRKSNGAGKSTIPSVIQWVLFGRTMHSRTPGNNIINWYSGKNCWAKLVFKNGDSITRTRNTDGKNELYISKDGDETKLISDTLSTSTLQQQQLNKTFNLDWEIFCGSVFFNQYGKPWMEMADATRKKAIERILHVDRLTYYAQASKVKCDNLDKLVEKHRLLIDNANQNIARLTQELDRVTKAYDNYNADKERRIHELNAAIVSEASKRDSIILPDITKLESRWNLVRQIEEKIDNLKSELFSVDRKLAEITVSIENYASKISTWEKKAGKVCMSCEQSVPCEHTSSKVAPIIALKEEKLAEKAVAIEHKKALTNKITQIEKSLIERRPTTSLNDAKSIYARRKQHENEISRLESTIVRVNSESNPHKKSIEEVNNKIKAFKEQVETTQKELERSELLNKHYHYIYKAYNDRTKIKSFVFRDHIPFINSRLKHYLDVFDLDVKIELTDALGITSNMWGYEYESGGERKRTDVAFMLAMFDFHEQMYGRQCNVLVLDEVDGRMDDEGVDSLINIIKTDLAHRVESIIVISHQNLMFDIFPREMRVVRQDRFSHLEIL